MTIIKRLELLRHAMQLAGVDFYLVPSTDAHNSEYVPTCWQRRVWISGFDGSMGEALITKEQAYLSTDGRYFLQAEQQLDCNCYTLLKQAGFSSEIEQWLKTNGSHKRLGVDPQLVGIGRMEQLQHIMAAVGGEVVVLEHNLIDLCRQNSGDNLTMPHSTAYLYAEEYSGESLADKLEWLRGELVKLAVDAIALNVLDEIAWLFNLRGGDVDFNPIVISYALITQTEAYLFVADGKFTTTELAQLQASGVSVVNYQEFKNYLQRQLGRLCLDNLTANFAMLQQSQASNKIVFASSPLVARKALKNKVESDGMRLAHRKDAVAMIKFFDWLEQNWQHGVNEISAADKLAEFRAEQANFKGLSFSTISGFAANGAIIHYRSTPASCKVVDDSNLYLVDSGGQYLEGTTDITRTIHLGNPTPEQKRHYTLVLKGHLAVCRAVFSAGTCGEHLDVLARTPLWNAYLNYRHGTGHGVGCFLCVHEGPQKISQANSNVQLLPGMVVSNEPGLYIYGSHGIRIENLCQVVEDNSAAAVASEYGPFYRFENLTLVPYCKKLIDSSLLDASEIAQINEYYQLIKDNILPLLSGSELIWLQQQLEFLN